MVKGSSSPNCSAKSPVSLQENSEPGDDDLEREDRLPCFSGSAPNFECDRLADVVDKVRNGILAGTRREDCEEGIVTVVGLLCSSPSALRESNEG